MALVHETVIREDAITVGAFLSTAQSALGAVRRMDQ